MVSAEVGTFTWPTLLYTSDITWVLVRLLWYVSLILAIGAIAVSLQQSVFLARITHTSASVDLIQELLSEVVPHRPTIRQPRQGQIILWQLANGLLETSIYFWLSGLLVFLWATTVAKPGRSMEDIIVSVYTCEAKRSRKLNTADRCGLHDRIRHHSWSLPMEHAWSMEQSEQSQILLDFALDRSTRKLVHPELLHVL